MPLLKQISHGEVYGDSLWPDQELGLGSQGDGVLILDLALTSGMATAGHSPL